MIAVSEKIKEQLYDLYCLIDNIEKELDNADEFHSADEPASDIDCWKRAVLNTIPPECSMKFRMDVESMLTNFKFKY